MSANHPHDAADRRALLIAVGPALYGESGWQVSLARDLGPYHPAGARGAIDERLVRRWISGDRAAPDWVGPALRRVCASRTRQIAAANRLLAGW